MKKAMKKMIFKTVTMGVFLTACILGYVFVPIQVTATNETEEFALTSTNNERVEICKAFSKMSIALIEKKKTQMEEKVTFIENTSLNAEKELKNEVENETETKNEREKQEDKKETDCSKKPVIPITTPVTHSNSVSATDSVHTHDYKAQIIPATCEKGGYTLYQCACSATYTDNQTAPIGHNYDSVVVSPTKQSEGYTNHTCNNCGANYKDNYTAKLPAVTFTDTNETVYANGTVNVRTGPGKNYNWIACLSPGNAVQRIGIGDNGWSKVVYNEKTAYVWSEYLQRERPFDGSTPSDYIASQMNHNPQLKGVMYIPSMGMNPCYIYCTKDGYDMQGFADAQNSAYSLGVYDQNNIDNLTVEIGDHNHHNFSVMKHVRVGTIAYINLGNRVLKMQAVNMIRHQSLQDYHADIANNAGHILTLCCSGIDGHRTVVKWAVTNDSAVSFNEYYNMTTEFYAGWREY